MSIRSCRGILFSCSVLGIIVFSGCGKAHKKPSNAIVSSPQEMAAKSADFVRSFLEDATSNNGKMEDSTQLAQARLVQILYQPGEFAPLWSKQEKWEPIGDSMFQFISAAQLWGLFPEDYHVKELGNIRSLFFNDSNAKSERKDASLWSKADLLLTDAFVQITRDIKLGRLPQDSITLRKDSVLADSFYLREFDALHQSGSVTSVFKTLEPKQRGYQLLKAGIKKFLDSADYRSFSIVPSPGKDRVAFKKALQKRLYEGGFIGYDSVMADSAQMSIAIKKFQQSRGINADGVPGEGTIRMLNISDREKFIRIAISLDRYKLLPEQMPSRYVWVNLPAYALQVIDRDTVKFSSKVICGKPLTRTPLLTSAISELITYPQWVPPPSIITKEILPAVKKNPGYLARKGFSLVNSKGEEVDPFSVDWTKYSKSIPYRVVQGSGDANSLGIMKFNFSNKYSVYLHDTNQRYLFGLTTRDVSHGCVRVQEWQKLATYIIRSDRYNEEGPAPAIDSMNTWLKRKEKHSIAVHNKFPVFIRYFTCEGQNGGIVFYDDIYGEDKMLRQKYFASK